MTNPAEYLVEQCDCEPLPSEAQAVGCEGCAPKMYVTCDEEAALAKMRALKEQMRHVSDRLRHIERIQEGAPGAGSSELSTEWAELSGRLDYLRAEWKNWELRLDEAIEQKLILLGHREPSR